MIWLSHSYHSVTGVTRWPSRTRLPHPRRPLDWATPGTRLGADNRLSSSEWPGAWQAALEAAFPGSVVLYCNGAEGDPWPEGGLAHTDIYKAEDQSHL